jgi:hypothetical protein
MAWATTLLAHIDVLQAYEEGLQEQELEELLPTQIDKQSPIPQNLPKNKQDNVPQGKGKDKMPPIERQLPNPLKEMRQKHAADTKLLAAQTIQMEGIRKKQEKTIADEAVGK